MGVQKNAMAVAILASLVLLSGCASTRILSVSNLSPEEPVYQQGVPVLRSVKQNTVVVRLLSPEFSNDMNHLPAFYIAVQNGGTTPFNFSTFSISASSGDSAVQVYTHDQLVAYVRRKAAWAAFGTALAGGLQAAAAATPQQTYTSGTATVYGSNGYATGTYSGTSTTYDPAEAVAAQAQVEANTDQQMAMIAAARDAQVNDLRSVLRENTVEPGQFVGGVVFLNPERIRAGQQLVIDVSVGDEDHRFIFDVSNP